MRRTTKMKIWVVIIWGMAIGLAVWVGASVYSRRDLLLVTPVPTSISQVSNTPPAPTTTPTRTPIPTTATPQPTEVPQITAAPSITASPIPSRTRIPSLTPGAARPTIIGYSVAGRPLEVFRFGRGPSARMIVAGIHGGYEWNTIALAGQLIEYLNQNPETVPENTRLFILRSFNPDGEARSRSYAGRANENSVDLNRNFPSLWQESWSRSGCWDYGPISAGTHPGSEPETQVLMKFIQAQNIEALISYHSAALGIFPGGQPPDPASISLAEAVASASDYPYPPIDTGCKFSGQLIDWASDQGVAAIDIELTDHVHTDFDQNILILFNFLQWQP